MTDNPYSVPRADDPDPGQWIQGRPPEASDRICFFTVRVDGEIKVGLGTAEDSKLLDVLAWMPVTFPPPFSDGAMSGDG